MARYVAHLWLNMYYRIWLIKEASHRIFISIDFDVDCSILSRSSYYSGTGFLTYVIADENATLSSGSMIVDYGSSSTGTYIIEAPIKSHSIYINIGNYYM